MSERSKWQTHYHHVLDLMRESDVDGQAWYRILQYIGQAIGASSGALAIRDQVTLTLRDPVATTWAHEALMAYLDQERPLELDEVIVDLTERLQRLRE